MGVALLGLAGSASASPSLGLIENFVWVPAGQNGDITVNCTSGGFMAGGGYRGANFAVYRSEKTGSTGWRVQGRNITSSGDYLYAEGNCLFGLPSGASIAATVNGGTVNVGNNSTGTSTATCSAGDPKHKPPIPPDVLLSGGFITQLGTSGSKRVMTIYSDQRSGSSWKVSAYNTTGGTKTVQAFAHCLHGYSGASSYQNSAELEPEGMADAWCNGTDIAVGGGYSIVRTVGNVPLQMVSIYGPSDWDCDMNYTLSSGDPDPNSLSLAQCLYAP
jgi:hypothetical protein